MLHLLREHRKFFIGAALAALGLQLVFFFYFPTVTDDSRVYAELATNWLQHGVYGQTQIIQQRPQLVPVDTRLPGYPAFLVLIFSLFGIGNFKAVMLAQILVGLGTCLIVADLARRVVSQRAARIAFVLTGLCPFLANYTAAALTETLEIFFTSIALDCAVAALDRMGPQTKAPQIRAGSLGANLGVRSLWAATGAAIAACILLRPDGGMLLAAVLLYLAILMAKVCIDKEYAGKEKESAAGDMARIAVAGIIVAVVALAPLVPWAIRNFRTLHHVQPLAPRYATEPEELNPVGFNRWVKTWLADYASVEETYWNVQGDKIDPGKLPARALDEPPAGDKEKTLALIADYNQSPERELTPEMDACFGELASARIRAHPVRYYVVLPLVRVADMWLRPRTEILPPDVRWWEFDDEVRYSITVVAFGLLNLAYMAAALLALVRSPWRIHGQRIRWSGLLVGFMLVRSALLLTVENPEPRYTLECYPVVIVCAAGYLAEFWKSSAGPRASVVAS